MKSKVGKLEIHTVALNHNLPDHIVQDIMDSVFAMIRETIESSDRATADYPIIGLTNFGKFFVSDAKKEFIRTVMNERKRLKDENRINNKENNS